MRRMLLAMLLLLLPVPAAAQPAETADIPRTPGGRPALTGVWTNSSLTPLERPDEYGDREFHTAEELVELQRTAVQRRIDAPDAGRKPSWPSSSARSGWSRDR